LEEGTTHEDDDGEEDDEVGEEDGPAPGRELDLRRLVVIGDPPVEDAGDGWEHGGVVSS
jgi:hypothetical protein